jgi:hypothetical protein
MMKETADKLTCRHCGAALSARATVENEYGAAEWDRFACGAETGWRERPCPKDPRFPKFEDYEVICGDDGERFYSHAIGKTDAARAVELRGGPGKTRESAAKWVEKSYILARDGYEAAEAFIPWYELGT